MLRYRAANVAEVALQFYRSPLLLRVLGAAMLLGLYALGVVEAIQAGWLPRLDVGPLVFPVLTLLISFLLGFRTNTAYDRWWEARRQWGALVSNSRALAVFVAGGMRAPSDAETRAELAGLLSAFAAALNHHLRGDLDVARLPDLDDATRTSLEGVEHVPLALAFRLCSRLDELGTEERLSATLLFELRSRAGQLLDVAGACERIKNTPMPFAYSSLMKNLVLWFCLLLPVGVGGGNEALAVFLTMLAWGALGGLELIAASIEDPFGYDENDLALGRLSRTVRRNVHTVLVGAPPADEPAPAPPSPGIHVAR